MNARLRILHAIRSDGFAGVEQFVRRLAIAQADDGHHVHVIGGDPARMRDVLNASGVGYTPATRTPEVARAVRRLRRHIDVVNTHMTAADLGAAFAFSGMGSRAAVVATRHFAQPRGRVGRVPIDAIVRRTIDAEIAISESVAAAIGVPSTVVHPGVETRPATDPALRTQTVLMAQRLQPEKATDVGIRAFAASGLAARGWMLDIAGEGGERDGLQALAASVGIGDTTRFLGFREDLPALMTRAGLLLAPCPFEHFGLTVVEAMASGLPVVAADAAGHREMLGGLDSRALFEPHSEDAAAAHMASLAADVRGRAALGESERARQSHGFSLRAQVEATEDVYRRTIAARRSPERAGEAS